MDAAERLRFQQVLVFVSARVWLSFLSQKLLQLAGAFDKSKASFIIPDSAAKLESALKEPKRLVVYQHALLAEEQLKRIK